MSKYKYFVSFHYRIDPDKPSAFDNPHGMWEITGTGVGTMVLSRVKQIETAEDIKAVSRQIEALLEEDIKVIPINIQRMPI